MEGSACKVRREIGSALRRVPRIPDTYAMIQDFEWSEWLHEVKLPENRKEYDWFGRDGSLRDISNFVSKLQERGSGSKKLAAALYYRLHYHVENLDYAHDVDRVAFNGATFEGVNNGVAVCERCDDTPYLSGREESEGAKPILLSDGAEFVAINAEPELTIGKSNDDLHYVNRLIDVSGRKSEIEKLRRFASTQKGFRWLQLAGTAGQGKSRLAMELVLETQDRWHAGFLLGDQLEKFMLHWQEWCPTIPTLIVVDYVLGVETYVKQAIQVLAMRTEEFDVPVCLLLVERQRWDKGQMRKQTTTESIEDGIPFSIPSGRAEWFFDLCEQKYGDGDAILNSTKFEDGVVELGNLSVIELREITRLVAKKRGHKLTSSKNIIDQNLMQIDRSGSPLYAYFLAEAMISGEFQSGWGREDLLEHAIQRDLAVRWRKQADRECPLIGENTLSMRVATLAAMVGDLDCTEIGKFPNLGAMNNQSVREALILSNSHIGVGATVQKLVQGLQPDILGEWFVLSSLSGYVLLEPLAEAAWDIAPNRMMAFLQRCVQDFPAHPITLKLVGLPPTSPNARDVFVENAVALSIALFSAGLHQEFPENLKAALIDAAEKNAVAAAMIGYCHLVGIVFVQDEARGVDFFLKAANGKNGNAMYNMGVIKMQGIACTPDPKEALNWWFKAEDAGDTASMYNIAMCYKNGEGVEESSDLYWVWMRKSAEKGDREAMATIGYHYEFGVGVEPNEEIALQWYVASWKRAEGDEYPNTGVYSPLHQFAASLD